MELHNEELVDDSEPQEQYTELHRVLLTHLRSVRCINYNDLLKDFKLFSSKLDSGNDNMNISTKLESYVSLINTRIGEHGFKIDKKNDDITGELYYIYKNTIMDETIKSNSNYSNNELNCIKLIIDDILESTDFQYSLSRINVQQKISNLLSRTLREAQFFIIRLIDDGWFNLTNRDHLILSLRTICELRHYLIDTYRLKNEGGSILLCKQCEDIVMLGYTCKNEECPISFHYKCLDIFKRSNQHLTKCINDCCSENWEDRSLVRVGVDISSLAL